MDREALDRVAVQLAADSKNVSAQEAVEILRRSGYSVVELSYVIVKAYNITLGEAKELAVMNEMSQGRCGSPLDEAFRERDE